MKAPWVCFHSENLGLCNDQRCEHQNTRYISEAFVSFVWDFEKQNLFWLISLGVRPTSFAIGFILSARHRLLVVTVSQQLSYPPTAGDYLSLRNSADITAKALRENLFTRWRLYSITIYIFLWKKKAPKKCEEITNPFEGAVPSGGTFTFHFKWQSSLTAMKMAVFCACDRAEWRRSIAKGEFLEEKFCTNETNRTVDSETVQILNRSLWHHKNNFQEDKLLSLRDDHNPSFISFCNFLSLFHSLFIPSGIEPSFFRYLSTTALLLPYI